MALIEINDLYKIFGPNPRRAIPLIKKGISKGDILKKTGCTVAINGATFAIEERETFVVMGLSGSGKSTFIRCLNRLIEPTQGSIRIDGEDIMSMDVERLRDLRRHTMSMVFQSFGLLPHRDVVNNVEFGLEISGVEKEERNAKALDAIRLVGLEGFEHSPTSELSGGMQQRVGLARALANDPRILLMDEAFSALDPLIRTQMQDELLELQAKMHKTIVFITHDPRRGAQTRRPHRDPGAGRPRAPDRHPRGDPCKAGRRVRPALCAERRPHQGDHRGHGRPPRSYDYLSQRRPQSSDAHDGARRHLERLCYRHRSQAERDRHDRCKRGPDQAGA